MEALWRFPRLRITSECYILLENRITDRRTDEPTDRDTNAQLPPSLIEISGEGGGIIALGDDAGPEVIVARRSRHERPW